MILKANSRANGQELAQHLMNAHDNEHVHLHELSGFCATDLYGAFKEAEAISRGTKCQQYLFSLSLNPPADKDVSVEVFEDTIGKIEKKLGLADQPRAIVFHEKNGRRHAHCVWSRINVSQMRAINLPHYKRRLMDISRDLYIHNNWDLPAGFKNPDDRSQTNYAHPEAAQAKRIRRDPAKLKAMFANCLAVSDSRAAFAAALWEQGYCLARGDRRGFVAVDAEGEVYSLSRWCGVKAKELRSRFGFGDDLPTVDEAIGLLSQHDVRVDNEQPSENWQQDYKTQLADLVERQRSERLDFSERQETTRIAALKFANNTLPRGLKAVWAKLDGSYQRQFDEIADHAKASEIADAAAMQVLVQKHLSEWQSLNQAFDYQRLQQSLANEFVQHSAHNASVALQLDPHQPLVLPREKTEFTVAQLKRNPTLILDHISHKKARFTRNDIMRGLSDFIDEPLELRVASDIALRGQKLIRLDKRTTAEFTTSDYQDAEQQLVSIASQMNCSRGFSVSAKHIKRAIKQENASLQKRYGASLGDEQIDAIHHVLQPNQLSSIIGLAGTGKSTMLSVAREAWELQGYKVYGAALAGKAADSLQSASGIQSRTLASLEASWKNGYEPIDAGSVVVVDEAGMVGTRQLKRVSEALQARGCKLVLVGDPDQLQPIEAGTPFKKITDNLGASRLTEIRRQNTDWQREASRDLASGQMHKAIAAYDENGFVHQTENRDNALAGLVEDYVSDLNEHGDNKTRLALAHRRKDVHAINQAIRQAKKQAGTIADEFYFETDTGPRAFANGDRLLFTRNDRGLGVKNGMLATVEKVDQHWIKVRLDSEDETKPRTLTFSPREFPAIDHGYAVTIHRAQGCTVDSSFVLSSKTLDHNLAYVALTRHKQETNFYSAPEIDFKKRSPLELAGTRQTFKLSRGLKRNR